MNDNILENKLALKDLGVIVDNNLGRAKHLKVPVILFKRVRTFFAQKVKPKFFFSKMKKNMIRFYFRSFRKIKQTQNPSKIRRLKCSSLVDFFEILKIISEYIFFWNV